jgi:hypothetical protein
MVIILVGSERPPAEKAIGKDHRGKNQGLEVLPHGRHRGVPIAFPAIIAGAM